MERMIRQPGRQFKKVQRRWFGVDTRTFKKYRQQVKGEWVLPAPVTYKSNVSWGFLRILGRSHQSFEHSSACLFLCHWLAWGQGRSPLVTGTSLVAVVCIQLLAGSTGAHLDPTVPGDRVSKTNLGMPKGQVLPRVGDLFAKSTNSYIGFCACILVPEKNVTLVTVVFCQSSGRRKSEELGTI